MSTDTTDVEDVDEPAEHMTPLDFACKVDWEGGIFAALEYGLHATGLDPDDPASAKLRDAWAELERVHRDVLVPAVQKVRDELEKISDENGGTPA